MFLDYYHLLKSPPVITFFLLYIRSLSLILPHIANKNNIAQLRQHTVIMEAEQIQMLSLNLS